MQEKLCRVVNKKLLQSCYKSEVGKRVSDTRGYYTYIIDRAGKIQTLEGERQRLYI